MDRKRPVEEIFLIYWRDDDVEEVSTVIRKESSLRKMFWQSF